MDPDTAARLEANNTLNSAHLLLPTTTPPTHIVSPLVILSAYILVVVILVGAIVWAVLRPRRHHEGRHERRTAPHPQNWHEDLTHYHPHPHGPAHARRIHYRYRD